MPPTNGRSIATCTAAAAVQTTILDNVRSNQQQDSAKMEESNNTAEAPHLHATKLRSSRTTPDSMASDHSRHLVAIDVRGRAYGNPPAWSRNEIPSSTGIQHSRTTSTTPQITDQSNVPPKVRGVALPLLISQICYRK
jgi:hypothetical protein